MARPEELLCRKEIAALFKRHRVTVWRWEREGLRLVDGRTTAAKIAWFLEQRDVAEELGIECATFLAKSREEREALLAKAIAERNATSCNIAGRAVPLENGSNTAAPG